MVTKPVPGSRSVETIEKRARNERDLDKIKEWALSPILFLPDPARNAPVFFIVSMDREPGAGYGNFALISRVKRYPDDKIAT